MKERPILFSGPMVRAILEGRKTQTRRPVKFEWCDSMSGAPRALDCYESEDGFGFETEMRFYKSPFGVPGDRLWVRETFATINRLAGCELYPQSKDDGVRYQATWTKPHSWGWKPSIHMPRWASRITLEVVSVRVERVQDISEEDAQAEGVEWPAPWSGVGGVTHPTCIDAFRELWESVYGAESWHANQWVWVVEFKRLEQESPHAH